MLSSPKRLSCCGNLCHSSFPLKARWKDLSFLLLELDGNGRRDFREQSAFPIYLCTLSCTIIKFSWSIASYGPEVPVPLLLTDDGPPFAVSKSEFLERRKMKQIIFGPWSANELWKHIILTPHLFNFETKNPKYWFCSKDSPMRSLPGWFCCFYRMEVCLSS